MIPTADEIDPSTVTPGAEGLVVFIFLLVAGYLLFRSLRKQLRRVDFEEQPEPADQTDPSKQL